MISYEFKNWGIELGTNDNGEGLFVRGHDGSWHQLEGNIVTVGTSRRQVREYYRRHLLSDGQMDFDHEVEVYVDGDANKGVLATVQVRCISKKHWRAWTQADWDRLSSFVEQEALSMSAAEIAGATWTFTL